MGDIKVPCKRCNRQADASQFTLDPVIGAIVCPQCVHERKVKIQVYNELEQEKHKLKAGEAPRSIVLNEPKKAIIDTPKLGVNKVIEKVKKACYKCKYKFSYDAMNDTPKVCPYCNTDINDRYAFR